MIEHNGELAKDGEIVKAEVRGQYPAEVWDSLSYWLNIPLDPDDGPMGNQLAAFFRHNVVASGYRPIKWYENYVDLKEYSMATANLLVPRPADNYGIPTVGWHLFEYALPESLHIEVIANRQNTYGRKGPETRGAEARFTKLRTDEGLHLDRHSSAAYTVGGGAHGYVYQHAIPTHDEMLGRRIRDIQEDGATYYAVYYVSNSLPQLPAPGLNK